MVDNYDLYTRQIFLDLANHVFDRPTQKNGLELLGEVDRLLLGSSVCFVDAVKTLEELEAED